MKVSLWIPDDTRKEKLTKFIKDELSKVDNIKDASNRKHTKKSLNRIKYILDTIEGNLCNGICIYTDGDDFVIDEYGSNKFLYKCGNEFIKPDNLEEWTS
jgi:peptide subunit release factor 1 (eRF1)